MYYPPRRTASRSSWLKMRNALKTITLIPPFYMTSMRAWPAENRVDIRGELKTWIGDSKPYSEIKSYVIQFSRVDGVSWLARFGEINNEKN
nr:TraE/TraK family type IV conjugative transfer system protein [Klebsiella pneumoniae]